MAELHKGRPDPRWNVQPLQTVEAGFGYCPDPRCGEEWVAAVRHPDVEDGSLNRCPTCLSTLGPAPSTPERSGSSDG